MAKKKKADLIDLYNELVDNVNLVGEYIQALESPLRPSGDGAREAFEDEVKELFSIMRKKLQRIESRMCNKIWEE